MHETDTGHPVANPRRTRLGADWTARSATAPERSAPTPSPTSGEGERAIG